MIIYQPARLAVTHMVYCRAWQGRSQRGYYFKRRFYLN